MYSFEVESAGELGIEPKRFCCEQLASGLADQCTNHCSTEHCLPARTDQQEERERVPKYKRKRIQADHRRKARFLEISVE